MQLGNGSSDHSIVTFAFLFLLVGLPSKYVLSLILACDIFASMGPRNAYKVMLDNTVSLIVCVRMNHQNQLEQMANGTIFATNIPFIPILSRCYSMKSINTSKDYKKENAETSTKVVHHGRGSPRPPHTRVHAAPHQTGGSKICRRATKAQRLRRTLYILVHSRISSQGWHTLHSTQL
jgi:hypothetical protein